MWHLNLFSPERCHWLIEFWFPFFHLFNPIFCHVTSQAISIRETEALFPPFESEESEFKHSICFGQCYKRQFHINVLLLLKLCYWQITCLDPLLEGEKQKAKLSCHPLWQETDCLTDVRVSQTQNMENCSPKHRQNF